MSLSAKIMEKMKEGHGLIAAICDLVEASDEIDYHDVADIVRENPTMMAQLEDEFKKRNMLKSDDDECDLNLTEIFKDL